MDEKDDGASGEDVLVPSHTQDCGGNVLIFMFCRCVGKFTLRCDREWVGVSSLRLR